jgi:hypothetical protein
MEGKLGMSSPKNRRTLSVALMTLAFTAITQVSNAASETVSETQSVTDHTSAQSGPLAAVAKQGRAGNRSPLTLYLEDPYGKALQLVYVEGPGWRYERPKSRDSSATSFFRKIALWSVPSAPVATDVVQSDEPLTVIIDGPTGYTYVWSRDGGWKFVGALSGRKP